MEDAKIEIIEKEENVSVPKYANMISGYQRAIKVVDDVILKNYVSILSKLDVIPLEQSILENNIKENVLFFKINEMVYEKDEFASYKFASVFNSLATTKSAVFVIIDSDGIKTDFYMGIRSMDDERTTSSLKNTLENAMFGQFPGIKTTDYTIEEINDIVKNIKDTSISAVSCVANNKERNQNKNEEFVQGLEKLVLSMNGQKYTGIIIANTTDQNQLRVLRKEYENVYTQLSPFATIQVNYGQNSSKGRNESNSDAISESVTRTVSTSDTEGTTYSTSTSTSHTVSKENTTSKVIKGVASASAIIGTALAPLTGGTSMVVGGLVSGGLGLLGTAVSGTVSDSDSSSESKGTSNSHTYGESSGTTNGTTQTSTSGTSESQGLSNGITLSAHDKSIENMLQRINKQLERMDEFESLGMYECTAYFLSENQYASEMAASTYKAIMGGINTGVEVAAINSWGIYEKEKTELVAQYVKNFMHPIFNYKGTLGNIEVTPSVMVSGSELSIHMGLPRKSVCGLPVIEHSDFGKEVVKYDGENLNVGINLGKVFNMGSVCNNNVILDKNSLSMHTFVTGSTGSGKSNTIYELVRQCNNMGINFMIIEPAKGEYKHVFGNRSDVRVYGSNPEYSDLLRINPFKFPKGIHVLEHVDRLVEIFNVCWPMYAAMPAVLKEALLKSYEECGWDFATSNNIYDESLFPTFIDLQDELVDVINDSSYSEEVKSNYMGSLVTRVKSLTNGLNGQIFSSYEIDNKILFDKNVIIDLSRIGSLETKSLIMGVLVMRLSEYRMSTADDMNMPMKHITVLEEAHNILKRTSTEQNPENPSVAGKSVEMISNAIAEMRTYGEGFIIVDQSPSAVDFSAIRNTNTKIIMRLPDESDRHLAGKAAGLKDSQLDEIAKLPKGVAVVYQNDWVDPVLCKISKYKGQESRFKYQSTLFIDNTTPGLKKKLLEFLLKTRVKNSVDADIDGIKSLLSKSDLSSKTKLIVKKLVSEYEEKGELIVWSEDRFSILSEIVGSVLNSSSWSRSIMNTVSEFSDLTDRLIDEIERQAVAINDEYALAAAQCVLKRETRESDEYQNIYMAWISDLRNKGVF